ncbi:hypothetical protein [Nannocystis pusilla]|uniref:Uncharacterized protein n=1 Tax=Nannocystis pusilla TaxID=889268 RepID=A0ABS7TXL9_9BACT|nr:hypothetical protein [Nannocystis pusilla]MBZ5713007.1 hypothetical protein [Nannocystis pusilla]
MTLSTVFWVAVLSQVPAETSAEPWQPHEAECYRREDAEDFAAAGDACRRAFETVPDGPHTFGQRSLFAFKAVRLYKRARAAGGHVAPLCSAAAVLRAFGAQLATLPAGERSSDRADVADGLRTIEPQIVGACVEEPADDAGDLIDVRRRQPPADPPVTRSPPRTDTTRTTVRRRPLRIAGGVALGAGLGLGAAAIAMLVRAENMQAQVDALNATYPAGVRIPDAEWTRYQYATIRGERADRLAIGLGAPAIAAALSGVVLLAIDAHRGRAGHFALHPGPAGIRFRMEF